MSDVLYVPQLAEKLGRTEAAIRAAVNRKTGSVPPSFRLGKKIAWRAETVDAWLEKREAEAADDGQGGA